MLRWTELKRRSSTLLEPFISELSRHSSASIICSGDNDQTEATLEIKVSAKEALGTEVSAKETDTCEEVPDSDESLTLPTSRGVTTEWFIFADKEATPNKMKKRSWISKTFCKDKDVYMDKESEEAVIEYSVVELSAIFESKWSEGVVDQDHDYPYWNLHHISGESEEDDEERESNHNNSKLLDCSEPISCPAVIDKCILWKGDSSVELSNPWLLSSLKSYQNSWSEEETEPKSGPGSGWGWFRKPSNEREIGGTAGEKPSNEREICDTAGEKPAQQDLKELDQINGERGDKASMWRKQFAERGNPKIKIEDEDRNITNSYVSSESATTPGGSFDIMEKRNSKSDRRKSAEFTPPTKSSISATTNPKEYKEGRAKTLWKIAVQAVRGSLTKPQRSVEKVYDYDKEAGFYQDEEASFEQDEQLQQMDGNELTTSPIVVMDIQVDNDLDSESDDDESRLKLIT